MEDTISFIVRYERNSCFPYITYFFSWQYDVKLLNKGKKIIVNLIKKSYVDYYRNRQSSNKDEITEIILYDDDIQLSKSQIDLLKIFYKPNCNGIFQIFVDCTHIFKPDDALNYFCEIIDDMKKNNELVFTRDEINTLNNNHNEEINTLNNNHSNEINTLNNNHNEEINTLNNNHNEEINTLNNNHSDEINTLKNNYSDEINTLNNNHSDEINKLNNNYKEKVYRCKINHEKEINKLKKYNYDYNKLILDYKLILKKLLIETDNKTKTLINKINQIKNNILEKTIENNKLKLQLEDITELYNLSLHDSYENAII